MAHAAPAQSAGSTRGARGGGNRARLIHLFTGAQAPFWMAAAYGLWASVTTRYAGPVTGWNVFFGLVTGILFGVFYVVVRAVTPAIPRLRRALVWAVFWALAVGFLHSLSNSGILWDVILALIVGAATFAMAMYHFFTKEVHDDAH